MNNRLIMRMIRVLPEEATSVWENDEFPCWGADPKERPLYLVIGKAGAGKDYFVQQACKWFEMTATKSFTTRPRRSPKDSSHHFVDSDWFARHREELIAYREYAGYQYGSLKEDVGKADFYIVDPQEAVRLKNELDRTCKIIFVVANFDLRFERMIRRQEAPIDKAAIFDRLYEDHFNFVIDDSCQSADYIVANDPKGMDNIGYMRFVRTFEEYIAPFEACRD